MDIVTNGLEYDKRAVPWVDFQEKMNYLLKKLIAYFSDKTKLMPYLYLSLFPENSSFSSNFTVNFHLKLIKCVF